MAEEPIASADSTSSFPLEPGRVYVFPGNRAQGEGDTTWVVQGTDEATGKTKLVSINPKTNKTTQKTMSVEDLRKKRALAGKIIDFRPTAISFDDAKGQATTTVSDGKTDYVEFTGTLGGKKLARQLIPLSMWRDVQNGNPQAIAQTTQFVERIQKGEKLSVAASGEDIFGAAISGLAKTLVYNPDQQKTKIAKPAPFQTAPAATVQAEAEQEEALEDVGEELPKEQQELKDALQTRRDFIGQLRERQKDIRAKTQARLEAANDLAEKKVAQSQESAQAVEVLTQEVEGLQANDPTNQRLPDLRQQLSVSLRDLNQKMVIAKAAQGLYETVRSSSQRQDAYSSLLDGYNQDVSEMMEDKDFTPEKRQQLDRLGSFLRPAVGFTDLARQDLERGLQTETLLNEAAEQDLRTIQEERLEDIGEAGSKLATRDQVRSFVSSPSSYNIQEYLGLMRQQQDLRVQVQGKVPSTVAFEGTFAAPSLSGVKVSGTVTQPTAVQGQVQVSAQVPTGVAGSVSVTGAGAVPSALGAGAISGAAIAGLTAQITGSGQQNQLADLQGTQAQLAGELESLMAQRGAFAQANDVPAMARTDIEIGAKTQQLADTKRAIEQQRSFALQSQQERARAPGTIPTNVPTSPPPGFIPQPILPNAVPSEQPATQAPLTAATATRGTGIPSTTRTVAEGVKGAVPTTQERVRGLNLRPIQMAEMASNVLQAQQMARLGQRGPEGLGGDERLSDTLEQSLARSPEAQSSQTPLLALNQVRPELRPETQELYAEGGPGQDLSPLQQEDQERAQVIREQTRQAQFKQQLVGGAPQAGFGLQPLSTVEEPTEAFLEATPQLSGVGGQYTETGAFEAGRAEQIEQSRQPLLPEVTEVINLGPPIYQLKNKADILPGVSFAQSFSLYFGTIISMLMISDFIDLFVYMIRLNVRIVYTAMPLDFILLACAPFVFHYETSGSVLTQRSLVRKMFPGGAISESVETSTVDLHGVSFDGTYLSILTGLTAEQKEYFKFTISQIGAVLMVDFLLLCFLALNLIMFFTIYYIFTNPGKILGAATQSALGF